MALTEELAKRVEAVYRERLEKVPRGWVQLVTGRDQGETPAGERLQTPEFDGYSEPEVHHHLGLCEEAGYLVLHPSHQGGPPRRFGGITRLTWKGHETLDAMRSGQ